jgi:small-conductance mechanosensitive channel
MLGSAWLERLAIMSTIPRYLIAAAGVALGIVLVRLLEKQLVTRWRRVVAQRPGATGGLLVDVLDRGLVPLGYYGVVALGIFYLQLPPWVLRTVKFVGLALAAYHGARMAISVVAHAVGRAPRGGADDPRRVRVAIPIVQVAIWGMALVFLLDNLGVQVSAVIAGLGIGGIAVALAGQAILGDLFSYVAIVFDRPFSIGDFIVVDTFMGTVEHIGIKTTRVRSLSGELIVFGNSNLMSARIRNFHSLERRRVVFGFGVAYQTPNPSLEQIPGVVREILAALPAVTLDRAHFQGFSPASLDFEVVYFVESPDHHLYMDRQQSINLELKRRFEQMGIELAAPARPAPQPPGPSHPPAAAGSRPG